MDFHFRNILASFLVLPLLFLAGCSTNEKAKDTVQFISISTDEAGGYLGYQVVEADDTLSAHWEIYTGPVKLTDQQELYAIAHRKGYLPSEIVKSD